jgi:hypothetical protein
VIGQLRPRGRGLAVGVLFAIATCGCTLLSPEPTPSPIRAESVEVAGDGRSVRVDFVGAAEFDPDDICTAQYRGTAEVVEGELVIGIFRVPHPRPAQEGDFCTLEGHARTLVLELDEPFEGDVIRDLAGQTFAP